MDLTLQQQALRLPAPDCVAFPSASRVYLNHIAMYRIFFDSMKGVFEVEPVLYRTRV